MQPGVRGQFRTFYQNRWQMVGCTILRAPEFWPGQGSNVEVEDDFGRVLLVKSKALQKESKQ